MVAQARLAMLFTQAEEKHMILILNPTMYSILGLFSVLVIVLTKLVYASKSKWVNK